MAINGKRDVWQKIGSIARTARVYISAVNPLAPAMNMTDPKLPRSKDCSRLRRLVDEALAEADRINHSQAGIHLDMARHSIGPPD